MGKIKNIIYTFCAALIATACTDGNDWEVDSSHDRLFATSESSFSITPAENAAQAEASWKATPNTTGYVIEVSTNPLSDEVPMGSEGSIVYGDGVEKITKTTYLLENLESETEYYARIKSVGDEKESNWVYYDDGGTFKTNKEQILKTPTEITDTSIKVSWEENCTVTSLRIYDGKGYDQTILLEAAELQNCSITIQGLDPITPYTIEIYNGDRLRGTITVNTEAGELAEVTITEVTKNSVKLTCTTVFDGYTLVTNGSIPDEAKYAVSDVTTVDITELTDNTKYDIYLFNNGVIIGKASFTTLRDYPAGYTRLTVSSADDFKSKIDEESGKVVFVIPENSDWNVGKVTIEKSSGLSDFIIWGEGTEKPKLKISLTIKNSFTTAELYNLELTTEESDSYTINLQDGKETVSYGTLKVEKCDILSTKNAIRVKQENTSSTISGIEVKDCVFNGFTNGAIMWNEIAGTMTGSVKITNSTFINGANAGYILRSAKTPFSLTAENCTFYVSISKNTVYDDGKVNSTFTVKNCLFGGAFSDKLKLISDGGTCNVSDSYSASDITWSKDYEVKDAGISTSELFPDMANGNYKAADSYSIYGDQNWN